MHAQPHLVVFTGDQLKGYSCAYKRDPAAAARTIQTLLAPVTTRGIPFAVTFGNHDAQSGHTRDALLEVYRALPGFVPPESQFDAGTYCFPVYQGNAPALYCFLIYSQKNKHGGGYHPVQPDQLDWFAAVRAQQAGIPALVFQHIPVPEVYELLTEVAPHTRGSVRAYRSRKGRFFCINAAKATGFLGEPPSVPDENSGEFSLLRQDGNVLGLFFGHDHHNSVCGKIGNLTLGYCPSGGFNEYGPSARRGTRLIELHQDAPAAFTTRVLTYRDLVRKHPRNLIKNIFYNIFPSSLEQGLRMIAIVLGITGAAIVTLILLLNLLPL